MRLFCTLSISLFFSQFLLAQVSNILLENPSFEGIPAEGTFKNALLMGWHDCGFPNETPADVHPKPGGGAFQVTKLPYDGETYLGLVTRDNNSWERVGQQLSKPLEVGKTYRFSIFLCRSNTYVSASRKTNEPINYATPVCLRIWAGQGPCELQELLATSELVTNTEWMPFQFELSPSKNYTHLIFEAHYKTPTPSPYNGNLLLDNASNLVAVDKKSDGKQALETRMAFSKPLMGTEFRIVAYHSDSSLVKKAAEEAFQRVADIEKVFSDYDETSEVSLLSEKGNAVVSQELWDMLNYCTTISERTDGAFDVTIGALTKLWRRAFRHKEMPTKQEIKAAKATVGYEAIGFNIPARKIWLKKPGMKLDFGAIAKGYAVDEAMQVMRSHGIYIALVDGGGDIVAGWSPPGQQGWEIELPDKFENGKLTFKTALLSNTAIATSGDTYRYLEYDGKRYSHIIDPRTGFGLTNRRVVTVTAPNCTAADTWATAASVGIKKSLLANLVAEGIQIAVLEN